MALAVLAFAQDRQPNGIGLEAMMKGARILVTTCTNVKPGETVLIVTDSKMMTIAQAVAAATRERRAEPVIAVIDQRSADSTEPPAPVAAAMKRADVIFTPVSISITHTQAIKDALESGARAIALSAFTEQMLVSGGIDADFTQVKVTCKAVGSRLSSAKVAHLTSKEGTDLTFQVQGRRINVMTGVVERGEFSPVPNAEVNVSPIEGTANGTLVVDASIPYLGIGLLKKPIRFTVKGGFIVGIEGGDPEQAGKLKAAWQQQQDPNVYNIAELGLGMNPKCRFVGLMLEDEGVLGSVHIGTGTNITLGGTVKAHSHYDLIMSKPTLELDGVALIQDGKLKL
jgi:leucyl aminopeptidase (aminopeptidase T)